MRRYKIILITILLFASHIALSQIILREISDKKEISKPMQYDSTCFMYYPFSNENEIKKYIGQEIYILPYSKIYKNDVSAAGTRVRGYYGFYDSPVINPDSFANKYLKILDADGKSYNWGNEYDWKLKLLYNDSDTIYYISSDNNIETWQIPFILPAFIEKSKKQFLGKKFVALGDRTSEWVIIRGDARDINTGAKIDMTYGDLWTCVDVTLVDLKEQSKSYDFYNPMLVFRNSKGNEITVNYVKYISNIYENREFKKFYYSARCKIIDEFESLENFELTEIQKKEKQKLEKQKKEKQKQSNIQKFGEYYGNLISINKVVIGMTKEMCLYSWGQPLLKNETLTENNKTNFWRYGFNTYLIFENDTLKLINQ